MDSMSMLMVLILMLEFKKMQTVLHQSLLVERLILALMSMVNTLEEMSEETSE